MSLFGRRPYERRDALTAASEASKKGKQKKAIAEYKRILDNDGPDPMIDHKLAVAYAESRRPQEAREGFMRAASAYDHRGFIDKALAVYVTAAHYLPQDVAIWEAVAETQLRKQRHSDALKALLDARKHFRRRKQRAELVRLLERACQIEPWHFEATFELAEARHKLGDRDGARALWEGLVERSSGSELRRARGAQFRSSPGPATMWRWMRALLVGSMLASGCARPTESPSIGAVCMRAKSIADRAHALRVQVAIDLKSGTGDKVRTSEQCAVTRELDRAVVEVYTILLDARLVTVSQWEPLSAANQKLVAVNDACSGEFSQLRSWAEGMQQSHEAAYQLCRALAKPPATSAPR